MLLLTIGDRPSKTPQHSRPPDGVRSAPPDGVRSAPPDGVRSAPPDGVRSAKTILYVDHTARLSGGEIALLNLVTALDHARFRPLVVLASDGPLVARLRAAGVETLIERLDPSIVNARKDSLGSPSLLRFRQALACVRYAVRLARLARRRGAVLIHTNSLKSDLYGGIAGRLAGIPVLWHVRDNIDEPYLPPRVAGAFRALSRVLPHVVVANSESTLRTLRPLPRQTTATVYSGVAVQPSRPLGWPVQIVHDGCDMLAPETSAGETPAGETPAGETLVRDPAGVSGPVKRPIIVLVGRIAGWKGQDVFIRAAAAIRDLFPAARFQIVGAPLFGEHEYEASLHALTANLGVQDQVEFLGFRNDVPALLAEADIVVHASTLGEPFGQVVIEGMAAGKPVIATDGGALPEIVLPGQTGFLVPMGDAPAMGAAIAALLSDPVRARAMGEAGRKRVQERFTISHTVRKLENIYSHLLSNHNHFLPTAPPSEEPLTASDVPHDCPGLGCPGL